jgi:hypothetical protein
VELTALLRRSPGAAYRIYDGEGVIVQAETMEVRVVNPTGARVWELVDGQRTVEEVVELICREFDASREDAERDVLEFLDRLEACGLVQRAG